MNFDPCSLGYLYAYLNRPDVQEALHANVTKLTYDWELCNDAIQETWKDSPSTVIPLLRELMTSGHRVWIYRYKYCHLNFFVIGNTLFYKTYVMKFIIFLTLFSLFTIIYNKRTQIL